MRPGGSTTSCTICRGRSLHACSSSLASSSRLQQPHPPVMVLLLSTTAPACFRKMAMLVRQLVNTCSSRRCASSIMRQLALACFHMRQTASQLRRQAFQHSLQQLQGLSGRRRPPPLLPRLAMQSSRQHVTVLAIPTPPRDWRTQNLALRKARGTMPSRTAGQTSSVARASSMSCRCCRLTCRAKAASSEAATPWNMAHGVSDCVCRCAEDA